jgi:hypothetical protein
MKEEVGFAGWAIVELMGHRRLAGFVTEAEIAGGKMLRLDVPAAPPAAGGITQFYAVGALYALTPTTEEIARGVAAHAIPAPVQRFELPAAKNPHPQPELVWCPKHIATADAVSCGNCGSTVCSTCAKERNDDVDDDTTLCPPCFEAREREYESEH